MLARSAEPPHALLFAGPEATGRTALALEYARMLNCEGSTAPAPAAMPGFDDSAFAAPEPEAFPCGHCRPCRLITEGAHPDVITLAPGDILCRPREGDSGHAKHPDSRDIRICQVRGTIDLVARYPFEARHRMILIDPAERLGREAAHTLLKTLEEPPGHTIFALITAAPESIIETILSRCRRIDVRPVATGEIEAGLRERGYEPAISAGAAQQSRGRPGLALRYAESPDLMGDRERLLARCAQIAAARTAERFDYARDLAERLRRDRALITADLDAWESFWESDLRRAAQQSSPERETESREALQALQAIVQCRAGLLANVQARAAFELMLLTFPRRTLAIPMEEEPAAYA